MRNSANLYAAITGELNHYADPDVSFVAHYGGPEGPKGGKQRAAVTSTYLLPMHERHRRCVPRLPSRTSPGYVSHDLTTPLGTALEQVSRATGRLQPQPVRSFGTYGVWFPRGLLLRSAAQKICLAF